MEKHPRVDSGLITSSGCGWWYEAKCNIDENVDENEDEDEDEDEGGSARREGGTYARESAG